MTLLVALVAWVMHSKVKFLPIFVQFSPSNPALEGHSYDPMVLPQRALSLQLYIPSEHSSTSQRRKQKNKIDNFDNNNTNTIENNNNNNNIDDDDEMIMRVYLVRPVCSSQI